jgi:hypothetical protein
VNSCSGYQTASATTGASDSNSKSENKTTATTAAINSRPEARLDSDGFFDPKPSPKSAWLQQAESQQISKAQLRNFHDHARELGWDKNKRRQFVLENYGKRKPVHLTVSEYHAALETFALLRAQNVVH